MEYVVQVVLTVALGWVCYKLGYKSAWDYITTNYIAIHKSAVIGPILIKRHTNLEGSNNEKNKSKRTGKKTSK